MSTTGKVAAFVAASAGLALVPSAFALGPSDFAVNIPDGPTQMAPPSDFNPTSSCTPPLPSPTGPITAPPGPGPYVCGPTSYSWSASATPMNGTVTVVSTGQTGTIKLLCDYNLTNAMTVTVGLANPMSPTSTVSGFSGAGGQACSWEIKVGASTLIGTLNGTTALTQVDANNGRFTGLLNIFIAGGSGEYANANGVGQMTQTQDFPFPTPSAPAIPSGGGMPPMATQAMETALMNAVAHQAGSPMKMVLVKGKPRATFIVPKGTITTSTKWKVHMAVAPGVTCSVKATKGSTTKNLGKLSKKANGQLVGSSYAPKALGKGTWTLKPTCKKSGKTLAAKYAKTAKLVVT